ncbi:MAG: MmgE/PrpD family protein [Burkholderiales bacterium]|nr:MmgE/PrpD family protein [Burkholderiales bacterium]
MTTHAVTAADDSVAARFAAWAPALRWHAFDSEVRRAAASELLDFAGDMIAGRAAVGMPAWLEVLLDDGGKRAATVAGGHQSAPWTAAMANGYFGHVLELDDTHDLAVLHAGASAIPAALAAAEHRGGIDGAGFLAAIVAGIELNCRLGVATDLSLVEGGWIYSALLGHFGAALAAAHVLGLDEAATRNALGIAYCFTCGNHQSSREGAPTKHLQPGIAAGNGLKAALMAQRGLTGVRAPFLGEDGFARVYLHGRFDAARAVRDLGRAYETARLSMKPYPSCRLTHPAVSAALALRSKLGERLGQVERVHIRMGRQAHDVVGRAEAFRLQPARWLDAQFSVFWTVAVALCHGAVTPAHLLEEVPPRGDVQAWIERLRAEPMAESALRDVGACKLEARGPFGSVQVDANEAKGHPDNPLTAEELEQKFCANLALAGIGESQAKRVAQALLALDSSPDLAPLLDALGRAQARKPVKER